MSEIIMQALSAIVCVVAIFLAFWFFNWLGQFEGRNKLQNELVQSGHAEYYLDEDNNKQWRMKK